MPAQGWVLPQPVFDRQVARQPAVPLFRARKGHGVGLFLAGGLDQPLGLAVGSGRVGPGADVPQPQSAASHSERLGDVSGSVVAHYPPALDRLAVEPGDSTAEKADHCWLLLVCQDLVVADPVREAPLAMGRRCRRWWRSSMALCS